MKTTPYVYIDMEIVTNNIIEKTKSLSEYGIKHRPHIKSHKSPVLGKMQVDAGAHGITVAKLGEAEVFAEAGFNNILIAYNIIGEDKLNRFEKLHKEKEMYTVVDSTVGAQGLSKVGISSGKPVNVVIEINMGEDRCGIYLPELKNLVSKLKEIEGIKICGLMTYHGSIYKYFHNEVDEIKKMVIEERDVLCEGAKILESQGIEAQILSAGSTAASCYPELLVGVTEIRCGNYIFHDNNNVESGLAKDDDCGLRVVATCVSKPSLNRATLDAGSKVLSSDTSKRIGFGKIVGHEDAVIVKLNEEHAMVELKSTEINIGDVVEIIPNHSCVVANLTDEIYCKYDNGEFKSLTVKARGLSR